MRRGKRTLSQTLAAITLVIFVDIVTDIQTRVVWSFISYTASRDASVEVCFVCFGAEWDRYP